MNNIAEKLKNAPIGYKIYTPLCGEVWICKAVHQKIYVRNSYVSCTFDVWGRYNENGECLLFPSEEVRDWNNFHPYFEWKKGMFSKELMMALLRYLMNLLMIK